MREHSPEARTHSTTGKLTARESDKTPRRTDSGDTMKHQRDSPLRLLCFTSRRRVFSSSHEVTWREGRVRKLPARPTARSTDRLPYRPPLHARVALTWQSAESTRGLLWPCETITSATADRAHVRALVVRCPCHRADGAVAARDCRARTGAHATISSCRLTEAKSMITMVTW